MNVEKSRQGLAALRGAAEKASGPLRAAIDASLRVAEAAVNECAQMQDDQHEFLEGVKEQFKVLDDVAERSIEKAEVAEGKLRGYELRQARKKLVKSQQDTEAAICDAVLKAVEPLPRMLTELLCIRRWTRRVDNERDVLTDQRKTGLIQVGDPSTGEISIVEGRAAAIALVQFFVSEHVDLSKIGMGLNVDLPEDKNPGRFAFGGAPAEWSPSSTTSLDDLDVDNGPHGPRVVPDDKDDDD